MIQESGGMMDIIKFNEADTREIVHLFYDTVHTVNAKDYMKPQLDAWAPFEELENKVISWSKRLNDNITYTAKMDNKIVGFGDLSKNGLLDRLYVHKNFQGKGIASALLRSLELEATALNLKEIRTFASITAKPFFESHEYTSIRINHIVRNGTILTNYVMNKKMRA